MMFQLNEYRLKNSVNRNPEAGKDLAAFESVHAWCALDGTN